MKIKSPIDNRVVLLLLVVVVGGEGDGGGGGGHGVEFAGMWQEIETAVRSLRVLCVLRGQANADRVLCMHIDKHIMAHYLVLCIFKACALDQSFNFRYPTSGVGASFKAFKVHAPGVHSVCFLDKGIRSQQVISVGGKDRCVAQVMDEFNPRVFPINLAGEDNFEAPISTSQVELLCRQRLQMEQTSVFYASS